MAKALTDRFLKTAQEGMYSDSACPTLYFRVRGNSKVWIQRLRIRGKPTMRGLGPYPQISLQPARKIASENREMIRKGHKLATKTEQNKTPTFKEAATIYFEKQKTGWKNDKHRKQWMASLKRYCGNLMDMRVDEIKAHHISQSLSPIWSEIPETAKRVRQRVSAIMLWAIAMEHRPDTNPAGKMLSHLLPPQVVVKKHLRALPHEQVSTALEKVRQSDAWKATKLCLEFLILTGSRSGEARGARWEEINIDAKTLTVPASRMKAKKAHTVPLSTLALEVLNEARLISDSSGLVFPSITGKQLSDSTLSKQLRDQGIDGTPHGMRTALRSWCAETGQNREAAEECLAHTNPNKVEAAYQRSTLLGLRRQILQDWSDYLTS